MDQRRIVAIGGGTIYRPCRPATTLAIDKEIVRLGVPPSGKKPKVLYVPTASGDNEDYCNGIYVIYQLRLGCEFDSLRFLAEKLTDEQIAKKIDWADIIYVGGGNTLKMMNAWRRRGVDRLLVGAYEQGKVMCGFSAGAICWFSWGLSNSYSYTHPENWKPVRVRGLGLLPQAICPHWDSEGVWRQESFAKKLLMSSSYRELGLALEDDCAFEVVDGQMRLISSQPGKSAHRLWWGNEEEGIYLRTTKLTCAKEFRPYQFGFTPLLSSP